MSLEKRNTGKRAVHTPYNTTQHNTNTNNTVLLLVVVGCVVGWLA